MAMAPCGRPASRLSGSYGASALTAIQGRPCERANGWILTASSRMPYGATFRIPREMCSVPDGASLSNHPRKGGKPALLRLSPGVTHRAECRESGSSTTVGYPGPAGEWAVEARERTRGTAR
jgi:hypothetical protein